MDIGLNKSNSGICSIDPSNIIATGINLPYTAIQDCYLIVALSGSAELLIDGVIVVRYASVSGYTAVPVLMRRGQVATTTGVVLASESRVVGIKK